MSEILDYSKYNITSTSAFNDGLALLKNKGFNKEVKKLFRIIDEIIEGCDMYEKEYARPLKGTNKMMHIHLDGRRTGDIILIYKVDGHDLDLDLRLHNITDHTNLSTVSKEKYAKLQSLRPFDVVKNKFTENQLSYAEDCYLELISNYKFHQLNGDARKRYVDKFLNEYFDEIHCVDELDFDSFLQLMHYLESTYHKCIFGSIDFSHRAQTGCITSREEEYIMNIFGDYDVYVRDAYIETEVDENDNIYEYMYVEACSDNFRAIKLLESELYSLDPLFQITFDKSKNGYGIFGTTYQFAHYFI